MNYRIDLEQTRNLATSFKINFFYPEIKSKVENYSNRDAKTIISFS